MKRETAAIIKSDFYSFCLKCSAEVDGGKLPSDAAFLNYAAGELDAFARGDVKRLIVNMPPRHFKTFLGSVCLTAWILAHDPSANILLLSYAEKLAGKNTRAIRKIIRSEWFKKLFKTRLDMKQAEFLSTTAGGSVQAISIDGGVTGFGADYIITDDPVQICNAYNEPWLERVNGLYDGQISSRL